MQNLSKMGLQIHANIVQIWKFGGQIKDALPTFLRIFTHSITYFIFNAIDQFIHGFTEYDIVHWFVSFSNSLLALIKYCQIKKKFKMKLN